MWNVPIISLVSNECVVVISCGQSDDRYSPLNDTRTVSEIVKDILFGTLLNRHLIDGQIHANCADYYNIHINSQLCREYTTLCKL